MAERTMRRGIVVDCLMRDRLFSEIQAGSSLAAKCGWMSLLFVVVGGLIGCGAPDSQFTFNKVYLIKQERDKGVEIANQPPHLNGHVPRPPTGNRAYRCAA